MFNQSMFKTNLLFKYFDNYIIYNINKYKL